MHTGPKQVQEQGRQEEAVQDISRAPPVRAHRGWSAPRSNMAGARQSPNCASVGVRVRTSLSQIVNHHGLKAGVDSFT